MATPAPTLAELRPLGPIEALDRAFTLVRRAGAGHVARAWGASLPLAACALGIHYLERVEGVRGLRFPFAFVLVWAWWFRALGLSTVARAYTRALRPSLAIVEPPPRRVDTVRTASVVGFGLWVWLWPLVLVAIVSPIVAVVILPLFALRGAVAPSWLARAGCAAGGGWPAFSAAVDDTRGTRGVFLVVELMVLLGALGLCLNVWAATGVVMLFGHSLFGLDVALVSSFLSPDNEVVMLFVTAVTLLLLEPLRAAASATAYVDARCRRDGADLHDAVEAAIASTRSRRVGASRVSAALVWLALASSAAPARAAPVTPDALPAAPAADVDDARVRADVDTILARHEFREFASHDGRSIGEWLSKLFRSLEKLLEDDTPAGAERAPVQLPMPPPWLLLVAFLLVVAIALFYTTRGRAPARRMPRGVAAPVVPTAAPPEGHLDEAARLAAEGDLRAALRALYLASITALDRAGLLQVDAARTNGQYVRSMPRGEPRKQLAALTRLFDRAWYGHAPASAEDYERGRALATRLCALGADR